MRNEHVDVDEIAWSGSRTRSCARDARSGSRISRGHLSPAASPLSMVASTAA
jgi:hypothetical protein